MIIKQVKAKCRRCGREANSNEFVLDPVYRMVVCPECVKERKNKEFLEAKAKKREEAKAAERASKQEKPPGWDWEDEEASRAYAQKMSSMGKAERIDETHVKYACKKCKYEFIIDTMKGRRNRCPYCGTPVQSYRVE